MHGLFIQQLIAFTQGQDGRRNLIMMQASIGHGAINAALGINSFFR